MKNDTYHIDVTEEEDALFRELPETDSAPQRSAKPTSFKTAFVIVLGVHIAGALALFAGPQIANSKEPAASLPVPTPTPITATANATNSKVQNVDPVAPATKPQQEQPKPVPSPTATKSPLVKEYTVKKGDNFNKIVKKYKLNPKKLAELNNIRDTNKLTVGQKLKFL